MVKRCLVYVVYVVISISSQSPSDKISIIFWDDSCSPIASNASVIFFQVGVSVDLNHLSNNSTRQSKLTSLQCSWMLFKSTAENFKCIPISCHLGAKCRKLINKVSKFKDWSIKIEIILRKTTTTWKTLLGVSWWFDYVYLIVHIWVFIVIFCELLFLL